MYFYKELKFLLVICVDDLKLAGPAQNLTKGWEILRSKLRIEPEIDLGLYLGCLLSKGTNRLHDGTEVTTMTYNMEGSISLKFNFLKKYARTFNWKCKKPQRQSLFFCAKCS